MEVYVITFSKGSGNVEVVGVYQTLDLAKKHLQATVNLDSFIKDEKNVYRSVRLDSGEVYYTIQKTYMPKYETLDDFCVDGY